jgi:hypothetical protein
MTMKVYAVYSIPKSPEYRLEKLFKTKESAKEYIGSQKAGCRAKVVGDFVTIARPPRCELFDIQIEEINE